MENISDIGSSKNSENDSDENYSKFSFMSNEDVLRAFESSNSGISDKESELRIEKYGYNEPVKRQIRSLIAKFLYKFVNPLIIILILIGVFTFFYSEKISAIIIFCMVIASILIEFYQEHNSDREVEKLIELVRVKVTVLRSGQRKDINIKDLVPGDIVELSAGDIIPADVRILYSKDLYVNESSMTGESFPVEKTHDINTSNAPKNISNMALMGTSVVSGTATAIIVRTGKGTEFSHIAANLSKDNMSTSFDRGIRDFIWLIIKFIVILTIFIFAINVILKGKIIEALMFSLAVAVGLIPEMLPMIVTVNLAKGAKSMSKKDVIVKHLDSIQNFGAMDVLCTDKTGTLTEDKIVLEKYCDVLGKESNEVLNYAFINSHFQSGLRNVLDEAILKHKHPHLNDIPKYRKIDELPFDFSRKIMSVVVEDVKIASKNSENNNNNDTRAQNGARNSLLMISKGAPEEIFSRAKKYELNGKLKNINKHVLKKLYKEYDDLSAQGFRVLAVAYKHINKKSEYNDKDEKDLIVKGYLGFFDPPKESSKDAIKALRDLGVEIKILTGDNEIVTTKICNEVGLEIKNIINGDRIDKINDVELKQIVEKTTVFTRLTPFQKERIIRALQENNHTVGFLGDGINDAPTLKRADVGISVNNGVDVAKESAGIILLNKNLIVLRDGVIEGRKVFGNLVKYIKMGASSNFGNMFSVAGASIFLPFLPMLPIQIILNNFLYDISQLFISSDNVDEEYLKKPRPWNIDSIKKFMITLGPLSSLFDFITFGIIIFFLGSTASSFQTIWFLESIFTQILVIFIIRTNKIPFIDSSPSPTLLVSSLVVSYVALVITTTAIGGIFGFIMLSWIQVLIVTAILFAYLIVTYFVKMKLVQKSMID